jgi:hypothetical protein
MGPHGDRAGDVILLANNGNREHKSERYYFAPPQQAWHGSPSHRDSDIPLIVAQPDRSSQELEREVRAVLGANPGPEDVGRYIIELRATNGY